MSYKLRTKQKGFTIIEVLIVLAIAGVIMLVVFLAVPALQRNSRNTQRRSDVSHMAGLINEFAANHTGKLPTGVTGGTGAGTCTAAASPYVGCLDVTNENFSAIAKPASGNNTLLAVAASPFVNPASTLDTFFGYSNATCGTDGATPTYSSSARSAIIIFYVEPGPALQCAQV